MIIVSNLDKGQKTPIYFEVEFSPEIYAIKDAITVRIYAPNSDNNVVSMNLRGTAEQMSNFFQVVLNNIQNEAKDRKKYSTSGLIAI